MVDLKIETVSEVCGKVHNELSRAIIGKNDVLRKILLAVLANSHILLEDYPGLAKTLIAKSLAATMGCTFS